MNSSTLVECSFCIPFTRDVNLSDGLPHETTTWLKLLTEMFDRFDGGTVAPGLYRGCYRDPDTHGRVDDESKKYVIALSEQRLDDLRALLREACEWFKQKCIYLSVAGAVEFIRAEKHESS